jgi:CO/xanthine dehydrogenase FAD-binding subunit
MILRCEKYQITHTVDDALNILSASSGTARIVAGGSDLLLEIQQGTHPGVRTLIDVTEIEEMRALEICGDRLFIGAAVTLNQLANSPVVQCHARALEDAAALMANPQVCNVATIGGNVAHALPAADGTIALLALDAQAEIADLEGRRRAPLRELFKGPGVSALDPGRDVLVGFYLPLIEPGEASAFSRRVNPQGIALAMLNVAVWLKRAGEHVCDIRIAVGPTGPVPSRVEGAEAVFRGSTPSLEILVKALEALLEEAHFRTSPHRASAGYRQHLARVLLEEAFTTAWQRADR